MKKLAIISAMLVFTLGMSAQTNDRRSTQEKSEKSTVNKTEDRKAAPARETTKSTTPAATKSATKSEPARSTTRTNPAPSNTQKATRTPEPTNQNATRTAPTRTTSEPNNQNATRTRTAPDNTQKATRTPEPNNQDATRTRTTDPERTSPANKSTDSRSTGNSSGVNRSRTPESGNVNETRKVGTPSNVNRREATTRSDNSAPRTTNSARQSSNVRQNHYDPKEGKVYEERRKVYTTPVTRRVVNPAPAKHYTYTTIEYRRVHYPYRSPSRVNIIWTNHMHNEYVYLYPEYDLWYYPYGYRIHTISAYDAISYVGEIAQIYGKVYDTWYSRETDEFYLFFGGPYPYQDFSVILSGKDARRYSRRPDAFFIDRHMSVTGLVSLWEGKPEMVIKKRSQIDLY